METAYAEPYRPSIARRTAERFNRWRRGRQERRLYRLLDSLEENK